MPATTILALDGIARMTRAEARLLAAAGRLGMDVRALAPSIEAVVARHAGVKTRLRIVVPTLASDMRPTGGDGGFEGVVARVRCLEPALTFLVMVPRTLCIALAEAVLGTRLPPVSDPAILEALVLHLVGDVLRCLPHEVPALRLDAVTTVSGTESLPGAAGAVVLHLRVGAGAIDDLASVIVSGGDLERLAARGPGSEAGLGGPVLGIRSAVRLVVGKACLVFGDIAGLARGDVVVLDAQVPGLGPGGPGAGAACDLGIACPGSPRFIARARLEEHSLAVVEGGPLILEGEMDRDDDRTQVDSTGDGARPRPGPAAERVRGMVAEVIVEAGRASLTVGDLLALAPGSVVPLGRPVSAEVTLSAGGRDIAHGVLVDVEGELGVQVLMMID